MYKHNKKLPERPTTSRRTRKAHSEVRNRYDLGVEANGETRTSDGKARYGASAIIKKAIADGSSKSFMYDSRLFASKYTRAELEELIRQCEQHDYAIGFAHVLELEKMPDKKKRRQIQTQTIENRWSWRQVRDAVREARSNGTF